MFFSKREGRITPEEITSLKKNEVFVFGSNESGVHGAGAAKTAKDKFGAIEGNGYGPMGSSFAIPTKGWDIKGAIPLPALECYVARFYEYCLIHPEKKFFVTKIGCGLAGWTPEDIAPLFTAFDNNNLKNVSLPEEFWNVIEKVTDEQIVNYLSIESGDERNDGS